MTSFERVMDTDDSWILQWDMNIHQCGACKRIYALQSRLDVHERECTKVRLSDRPSSPLNADVASIADTVTHIDDDGDIYLKATEGGSRTVAFLVASQVLWTSSLVFRKMLGPKSPFKEGGMVRRAAIQGLPKPTILCEDDADALEPILHVLHHRYNRLENSISFDLLLKIAIITDKYDLGTAITLWAGAVAREFKTELLVRSAADWLFLSWVFRWPKSFSEHIQRVLLDAQWDPIKNSLFFGEKESPIYLSDCNIPHFIQGIIASERARRIETVRQYISQLLVRHQSTQRVGPHCYYSGTGGEFVRRQCETLQVGYFSIASFQWKWTDDTTWDDSIKNIVNPILEMKGLTLGVVAFGCQCRNQQTPVSVHRGGCFDHSVCSWMPDVEEVAQSAIQEVFPLKLEDIVKVP